MGELTKEEIGDILRSVLQSTKGGVQLHRIQREFELMVGSRIQFNKFGYPSLEAMLKDMRDVVHITRNSEGDMVAFAVADDTTKHLAALIAKQRTAKAKPKPRMLQRRQPWRPLPASPRYNQRPPNRHVPSRPPLLSSKPPLLKTPQENVQRPYRGTPQSVLLATMPSFTSNSQDQTKVTNSVNNSAKPEKQNSHSQPVLPKSNFEMPPRFLRQQQPVPVRSELSLIINQPTPEPALSNVQRRSPEYSITAPPIAEVKPPPLVRATPSPAAPPTPKPLPTLEPGLPWPDAKNNKQVVDNYAYLNGLECVYKLMPNQSKSRRTPTWLSQLVLGDQKFNSYPNEMNTPDEANEEAAKRAVEKLKINPNVKAYPTASMENAIEVDRVAQQVKEILSDNPQGAVHFYIQEQFKLKNMQRLPPNWLTLIEGINDIRIDRADDTHFILFHEKSARNTPEYPSVRSNGSSSLNSPTGGSFGSESGSQSCFPDALLLPEGEYWEIYVSYATGTSNIWFRFCDYMDSYELLAESMETFYRDRQNGHLLRPVPEPEVQGAYCAFQDDTWHRVLVQEIYEDGKIECVFLDNGDLELLEMDTLFPLEKQFLELPFQALRAELFGLHVFSKDVIISDRMVEMVLGKSLVARPETIEGDSTIYLVLHDTSTELDVNVNDALLKSIFAEIRPLDLSQTGRVVEGILSAIHPTGEVWLQDVRSMNLLELLMDNILHLLEMKHVLLSEVSFSNMYCVQHNGKWYRAVPTSKKITDEKISMVLIDVGTQANIPLTNIHELDDDTKEITTFPTLAVRSQLTGIESSVWTEEASRKLLELVPQNTTLLIKVGKAAVGNAMPSVALFKRLGPTRELVSINETLAINLSAVPLERKLSRPNSLPSPSLISPSASYQVTDSNESPSQDNVFNFHPVRAVPVASKAESPLAFLNFPGTPSPIAYSPPPLSATSPVMTGSPAILTTSATIARTSVFNFGPTADSHKSPSPTLSDSSPKNMIRQQQPLPDLGQYFDVHITSAANPANFTCQSLNMIPKIQELSADMLQFYSSEENVCEMHHCLIKEKEFYAFKHKDSQWYRVCTQTIIDQDSMIVYLIDFGGFEWAKLQDMQPLYNKFKTLPYQAIPASLADVEPIHKDYLPEHCLQFKTMVEEKNFVSLIRAKNPEAGNASLGLMGYQISVILVDTSSDTDLFIHTELKLKGIART